MRVKFFFTGDVCIAQCKMKCIRDDTNTKREGNKTLITIS